uniref:Right handed beta helix domain-containing protein n=1 Tax=Vannella robusta TaxID=1487602 RepID=A0A7S4MQI4_9EUKA
MSSGRIFLLFGYLCVLVSALDVHVDPSATAGGDGSVNHPYSSVKEAITMENTAASSAPGLKLILSSGIYEGENNFNLTLDSKYIQLYGDTEFAGGAETFDVVFDALDSPAFAFKLSGIGSLSLSNIRYQNMQTLLSFSSPNHENSRSHPISLTKCYLDNIKQNAIDIQGVNTFTMNECTIQRCRGSFVDFIGNSDLVATAAISDVTIEESGGMYLQNIEAQLERVSFKTLGQRAVFLNPSRNSRNIITDCSFVPPLATAFEGSALYIQDTNTGNTQASVTISRSTFTGAAAAKGGAVWLGNIRGIIENSTFSQCSSNNGGAVILSASIVSISGCEFYGNTALNGGAIYLEQESTLQLEDNIFEENMAATGNLVYCDSEEDLLVAVGNQNSTFTSNDVQCGEVITQNDFSSPMFSSSMETSYASSSSSSFQFLYGYILVVSQAFIICILVVALILGLYIYTRRTSVPNEVFDIDLEEL